MRDDYADWLAAQGYARTTVADNLSELRRIEAAYGPVEALIAAGAYPALLQTLSYTAEDERQARPNPSRFNIQGRLRTNLASYKAALLRYRRFLDSQRAG